MFARAGCCGRLRRSLAATSVVWLDTGGHVGRRIWCFLTPYPSVVARPGSTVKFDLAVTAPAVSVAQLAVDQLPTRVDHDVACGGSSSTP